jgi:hypothetical protein
MRWRELAHKRGRQHELSKRKAAQVAYECAATQTGRVTKGELLMKPSIHKSATEKSIRLAAAMVGLSLAGFACNSNNNGNNGHTPQVQADQGPAWKLNYTADTGADTDKANVVAGYGFTVTADGNYIVGPGPSGQVLTGQLSSDEFNDVLTAIQPVLNNGNALAQAQNCAPSSVSDTNDKFVLTRAHKDYAFLNKAQDGTVCAAGIDTDGAEALRTAVITAAQDHYALPFPSSCLDAAAATELLYKGLTSCHHDSDCAYLDQTYTPIDAGSSELVYDDACSVVRALPVANVKAVQAKLADLQAALLTAQQACGADIVRANCAQQTTFQSLQAPAVCGAEGVCKINPSLSL